MTTVAPESHGSHDPHGSAGGDDHPHDPNLAHHFDTPKQQFDAGKLGIWLFLTTEILLFSGLFCAYAVYRANHPEVFEWSHLYLNKNYGALNTIVLIFSSLTMAWAVRAAQIGNKKLLVTLLAITLACGGIFMCVKYVEYRDKWSHQTLWAGKYDPVALPHGVTISDIVGVEANPHGPSATQNAPATQRALGGYVYEESAVMRAPTGPAGLNPQWVAKDEARLDNTEYARETKHWEGPIPYNTQVFFSIYFLMTGLHGIHVLAGMAVIAWLLKRSIRGDFGPKYFNPVDFVGLYWHVVDLVWIFLFPLLYLIK
jgi:cytochrome c oxidase subunit 3